MLWVKRFQEPIIAIGRKGGTRVVPEETMDETIGRIVGQYSPMLLRLAYARLGSAADAEDAVQETFLQLVSRRPAFRDQEHEKAWLIRTALCRASDIRRRADRQALPLEEAALAAAPPEDNELLEAVQALPEKYAAAIHLYYYEGYSIKEIARLLGAPAATIGARLARGRARLRQMLKED